MARTCDICGRELAGRSRFCVHCEVEVPEKASAAPPVAPSRLAAQFQERGAGKESEKDVPDYSLAALSANLKEARDKFQRADALFSEGRVHPSASLLQAIAGQLKSDAEWQRHYEQLTQAIADAQAKAVQRARKLKHDPDRLRDYLTRSAVDLLAPEEICRLALEAADHLYRQKQTEGARQLLRLPLFKELPQGQLQREHQRLEHLAQRRGQWQHFWRSSAILAAVIPVSAGALLFWIWFALQLPFWILLVIAVLAALAGFFGLKPLRRWLEKKLGEGRDEDE